MLALQKLEVRSSKVSVKKLGVDRVYEILVPDQVTGRHLVFFDEGLNFILGEADAQEGHGRVESGDELVIDTVPLPEFIVILEEGFHSDLLFKDLAADD